MPNNEEARSQVAPWETSGSILWFAMDAFWMFQADAVALALILPTLLCNLAPLRYLTGSAERLVAWAMNCWLAMNIAWMLGEIYERAVFYLVAKVITVIGFGFLVAVVAQGRQTREAWHARLRRFRRLRISS